jgi:hypothetical protein
MIAASHTVWKRARQLLAVLVASLFLLMPMAEAALVDCETDATGSQPGVSSQVHSDLHEASKPDGTKACCMSVCSLCYALFPTPSLIEAILESDVLRDFKPQRPIIGVRLRPAIGPPRSAG